MSEFALWVRWEGEITVLAADLRLGNDELGGVAVVGTSQGVRQDADGADDVADNLGLADEVRGVTKDHLGLGLELHLLNASHGSLDTDGLGALVQDLVDVGVEHVGAAIDSRQAGEALGELAETVERVDVGGLAVPGDRVAVEADALDGLGGLALGIDVLISKVESHGMANEVAGGSFKTELVVDLLQSHCVDVKT